MSNEEYLYNCNGCGKDDKNYPDKEIQDEDTGEYILLDVNLQYITNGQELMHMVCLLDYIVINAMKTHNNILTEKTDILMKVMLVNDQSQKNKKGEYNE